MNKIIIAIFSDCFFCIISPIGNTLNTILNITIRHIVKFYPKPTLPPLVFFCSYKERYKFDYNITVKLIINGDVSCAVTNAKSVVNKTTVNFNNTLGLFIAQQGGS